MADKIECPVDKSLSLFSKKWSIQIIRDLFFGKKHFKEFKEDKNITNKVLSNCLKELESNNLISKKVISTTPNITEYSLTERGKALNKVIYELAMFTLEDQNNNYNNETNDYLIETFKEKLEIKD
ncbi:MAG: helix-turn-helix domain-containing protein [Methanobrevibacter sp.]|uniref:winged helix-turn-helix transcriptional regulator n=1 Tax=Methanobrevibacter sp. TaxID=66852 RepID=UPI0026E0AAD3|nr:helix-turn-helix domain-containing protein [Methanobrevibacter sp.]MDO5847914.1 helix-turn-helix domain-containing protein [Methanobrevibacter sp.]